MKQAPKKKVLFLITKATWGGAQKYVYDLATHLPKDKFEPIVAFGESGRLQQLLNEAKIETRHIPSLGRDIALVSDISSFFQILICLWRVRPDVVHLNSSKAAALGALAAWLTRVPKRIFTVHGWPFKENRNVFARKIIYFVSWFTAFLSNIVIVVSKEDRELGERMWLVGKKVHYIPLALQTPEMYAREQVEKFLFLGPSASFQNAIRLVTIAELTRNKGLRYGIDMMVELEKRAPGKYRYAIIGEGEERSSLASYAERPGVELSVWFANFSSDRPPKELSSEASRFLRAFDVFILPSIKEGMPYVLLEAAAAGLPIIATDVVKAEASTLPNIYFVSSGDGHALADTVEKLARNLPARKSGTVRSFAEMLEKTVALYEF